MPTDQTLDFDVQDLPMDVFDLTISGLEVQTLTLGRGLDVVASCLSTRCYPCSGTTGCSSCTDHPAPLAPDLDEDEDE
ncbi:thiomuracin/GE37468 family thiazolyl RiPP peptide [Nonomuraea sp. SYSU D8015]|uniref:thiomuracin/GE37468 family thiazolyl RiPP peptide n=1 Tax=Nonomuraea sp. SYSU D8015 TaxID=2593644 RepID=UPI0016600B10|nr:thiomuracin/GE37468 family thiazolyl RiPP peptide [Nonomuraea sp. SYSU D8015]